MELAWRHGELSVRDVHIAFGGAVAYTTLMTTLDRLHKKGLLDRRKVRRAFFYTPRFTAEELDRHTAKNVIHNLLGRGGKGIEPVLTCIVEAVSERDRELLDELERLVNEKRQQLRPKEGLTTDV